MGDPGTLPEVYVIEDDAALRLSIARLLRAEGLPAVRTYESAEAFLDEAGQLPPGCVVTDVRMPHIDGLELVRRLKAQSLPLTAIVISGHADIPLAVEAMQAGAVDVLEKPFRDEALVASVRKALAARQATTHQGEAGPAPAAPCDEGVRRIIAALSPREREVMGAVVLGKTNKMIAREFDISPRTVEVHRANVMMKTGARSLSDLVRMAMLARF